MANQCTGKAASEIPALKPYRGKLAVRNFRGDDGNVGIIRSPLRAIVLPDSRRLVEVKPRTCSPLVPCTRSPKQFTQVADCVWERGSRKKTSCMLFPMACSGWCSKYTVIVG